MNLSDYTTDQLVKELQNRSECTVVVVQDSEDVVRAHFSGGFIRGMGLIEYAKWWSEKHLEQKWWSEKHLGQK